MSQSLATIINTLETYCQNNNLNHRFVGSVSFGGLLHNKTTWRINIKQRKIFLYQTNPLSLYRTDGTVRDIDIILLTSDIKKINDFSKFIKKLKKSSSLKSFPLISYEWIQQNNSSKNHLMQFVTAFEEHNNNLYLRFSSIKQKISQASLEAWTIVLSNNQSFTVRNPIADYYAYQVRNPSGIKPKDKEKIKLLKQLVDDVVQKGKNGHIDYLSNKYYKPWFEYEKQLQETNNVGIVIKRILLIIYWQSIGNYFAHGKGITRYFLQFSNQFT